MEMEVIKIASWEMNLLRNQKKVPKEVLKEIGDYLSVQWKPVMKKVMIEKQETTFSLKEFKAPTICLRVDMAPTPEGFFPEAIYEIDARPKGLGISITKGPTFTKESIREVFKRCRAAAVYVDTGIISDDYLLAEVLGIPFLNLNSAKLLKPSWIRVEEEQYHQETETLRKIAESSLCPLLTANDKSPLVRLGLAEEIASIEEINFDEPFVLKPLIGAGCKNVEIWLPKEKSKQVFGKKKIPGVSTKTRILKKFSLEKAWIKQPFIPPGSTEDYFYIWRLYYGWQCDTGNYEFLGGFVNYRKNLRIHGASDALFSFISF